MRATPTLVVLLINIAMPCAFALDGDVDAAFGSGGQLVIARPDNDGISDKPTGDVVILADGRFLWAAPLDDHTLWVGRNLRNGAPDLTFGIEGTGRINLRICGERFRPSRMIGDGASGVILWSDRCLRHIQGNGTVDTGFGSGPMPPSSFIAADLARDPSGHFLLAGRDGQFGEVYRFNEDGVIDDTFGTSGNVVLFPDEGRWKSVNALAVRPDGRILIGGSGGVDNDVHLFVAQLKPDGMPDFSWDDDGFVVLDPPPNVYTLEAGALRSMPMEAWSSRAWETTA